MQTSARSGSPIKSDGFWTILGVAGFVLILAYALYSAFTETGLHGLFMDLQFKWFGKAWEKLTVLLTMATSAVVFYAPLFAAKALFGGGSSDPARPLGAMATQPMTRRQAVEASWRNLRVIGIGLIVIAWVVGYPLYMWLGGQARADAGSVPKDLVLQPGAPAPDAPGKFVRLQARPHPQLLYGVTKSRTGSSSGSTDYYVPIVQPGWTTQEPLRYVLHFKRTGEAVRDDVAPPYVVEASANSLPGHVLREYERAGVKFASPMYVVDRIWLQDGKVADQSENYWIGFLAISGVLSLIGLVILIAGFVAYRARIGKV